MLLWGNWLQRRVLFLFIYFYLSRFLSSPSACRTSGGSNNRDYWGFFCPHLAESVFLASLLSFDGLWLIFFDEFCFDDFLMNFLTIFLTFNILTIASFRIGVPSILFFHLSYFFYTGQFCETDIDECIEDQPCQSGTCNNLKGGYECDCFDKFCGTNCQRRDVCIVSTHQAMGPKNYWKIRL